MNAGVILGLHLGEISYELMPNLAVHLCTLYIAETYTILSNCVVLSSTCYQKQ